MLLLIWFPSNGQKCQKRYLRRRNLEGWCSSGARTTNRVNGRRIDHKVSPTCSYLPVHVYRDFTFSPDAVAPTFAPFGLLEILQLQQEFQRVHKNSVVCLQFLVRFSSFAVQPFLANPAIFPTASMRVCWFGHNLFCSHSPKLYEPLFGLYCGYVSVD